MAFSEAIKSKVRKKAHLSCCLCKAIGVEVHHIIPQEENGPDAEENAAPLCPSCHETYGANPQKRKFIREARDLWYEICEKRYASDPDRLNEIKRLLQNTVSYEDFQTFKEELLSHMVQGLETPRNEEEILAALDELFDKVWYNRHQVHRSKVISGQKEINAEIWKQAQKAARKIEKRYGKAALGPRDDFEWGMINGKLSALRWVLGDEWDMLDT
ncbi:MAG TPA: HNH endonuclease [Methylomirabilota bacterium]|nr:HNH endonuclease [Methylomirabilota bacterium]